MVKSSFCRRRLEKLFVLQSDFFRRLDISLEVLQKSTLRSPIRARDNTKLFTHETTRHVVLHATFKHVKRLHYTSFICCICSQLGYVLHLGIWGRN